MWSFLKKLSPFTRRRRPVVFEISARDHEIQALLKALRDEVAGVTRVASADLDQMTSGYGDRSTTPIPTIVQEVATLPPLEQQESAA